jgi:hypothetical protein
MVHHLDVCRTAIITAMMMIPMLMAATRSWAGVAHGTPPRPEREMHPRRTPDRLRREPDAPGCAARDVFAGGLRGRRDAPAREQGSSPAAASPKQVGGNDEAADGTEAPRGRVEME